MSLAEVEAEAARRRDLVARGVSRFGGAGDARGRPVPTEEELREALEDTHQDEGDRTVLSLGGRVVKLSQKKRVKYTPGIPDRRYYFPALRLVFWWEWKAEWGRQSPAQRQFQEDEEASGGIYGLGRFADFERFLIERGVAVREGLLLVPARRELSTPASTFPQP